MRGSKRILTVTVERISDCDPDTSYLEQEGFEDRLEAYRRDVFEYIGIKTKAEIVIAGVCQTVRSGGLWGIESDSGEEHFKSVEVEELDGLRAVLRGMGFGARAISKAFATLTA